MSLDGLGISVPEIPVRSMLRPNRKKETEMGERRIQLGPAAGREYESPVKDAYQRALDASTTQGLQRELLTQALSMVKNYPHYLEEHKPEALERIELSIQNAIAISNGEPMEEDE